MLSHHSTLSGEGTRRQYRHGVSHTFPALVKLSNFFVLAAKEKEKK